MTYSIQEVAEKVENPLVTVHEFVKGSANAKRRVRFTCEEHGEMEKGLGDFLKSPLGCTKCGQRASGKRKRDTLEEVEAKARKVHGDKYSYSHLEYEKRAWIHYTCSQHGAVRQLISGHLEGKGCNQCGRDSTASSKLKPLTYYEAESRKVHGDRYDYLGFTRGAGNVRRLVVRCKEHGEFVQLPSVHIGRQGGCPKCGAVRGAQKQRKTFDQMVKEARLVHGDSFSYEPAEGSGMLAVLCAKHGKSLQPFSYHVNQKYGCSKCATEGLAERQRLPLESVVERALEVHGDNYDYLGVHHTFKGKTKIEVVCKKHGTFEQAVGDHLRGNGCPTCATRVSKPNLEIAAYLEGLGVNVEMEYRFPGSRKFFDIAVHSHKILIEYNSTFWHSSRYIPNGQHRDKTKLANSQGYRCIHIFGNDWEERQAQVKSLLTNSLGLQAQRVFARSCEVVKVDSNQAKGFYNANHIQGYGSSLETLGLTYQGKLVALMGFTKNTSNRTRKAEDSHVELARYATSCSVVGGFTKLLKRWLRDNPQVRTVVSFSDNSMFDGSTYKKAGFNLDGKLAPDYKYREPGSKETLYHKTNYQKSKLRKRFGEEFCERLTEKQITEAAGIYRVYDCGKTRWLLTT